jgi:hypothetical protein
MAYNCREDEHPNEDEHHIDQEDVPSGAQDRFLQSLMSLRRSTCVSAIDFSPGDSANLLAMLSLCNEQEGAASVAARRKSSLMILPADISRIIKEHVSCLYTEPLSLNC